MVLEKLNVRAILFLSCKIDQNVCEHLYMSAISKKIVTDVMKGSEGGF